MRMAPVSQTRAVIAPNRTGENVRISAEDCANWQDLERLGISFGGDAGLTAMYDAQVQNLRSQNVDPAVLLAGDAATGPQVTTANGGVPVQFLQSFLPGYVADVTAVRRADELCNVRVAGDWEDEEVVQAIVERQGTAQAYGDYQNAPLTTGNVNFERRSIVRFELGFSVYALEEARAAKMRINISDIKRKAMARALEIRRNLVAFKGFNSGANRTYGWLNDPNLPAYVSAGVVFSSGTFQTLTAFFRNAFAALRTQSQEVVDPSKVAITVALPTNCIEYLSQTTDQGVSVRGWLQTNYPKVSFVSAPELNNANGGSNVIYFVADEVVDDASTDGGATIEQVIQARTRVIGVERRAKGYIEVNSNATAGMFCKRPFATLRYTGI